MKKHTIHLQGNGNIVIQDAQSGDITINTNNPADILHKLQQLNDTQIDVMNQLAVEQTDKLSEIFKILLRGVVSQKNIVHGSISNVHSVNMGDEIHYEYHLHSGITTIPKELTIKIPKTSPDKIVGRDTELGDLRKRLTEHKQVVLVNGLGGIGKTTLAQVYAAKYWDEYRHVAWVSQISEDIVSDFVHTEGLLDNLQIPGEGKDARELFIDIITGFKKIGDQPNLLIIDNADNYFGKWYDYLPSQPQWHILVTSRAQIPKFDLIELDFLPEVEAVDLFLSHYTRGEIKRQEIKELVTVVDRHTLTIEILAKTAQLQRTEINRLQKAIEDDLKANVHINHKGDKIDKVTSYLSSIFAMSRLTGDEIWLLKQFACLPAEFYRYGLLKELIDPEAAQKEDIFAETMETLSATGWLLKNNTNDSYKMHRIVAAVVEMQQTITLYDIEYLLDSVTEKLNMDQTKDNPVDKFPWIPYGRSLADAFPYSTEASISLLQNNLALVLQDLGDYEGAKKLLEKAMGSAEKNFGPDHPTTAVSYSNLALVLKDLGDYEGAKKLLEKAMGSDEKNFGPDHPTTAVRYSNLATVLQGLGDYEGALELSEKALRIFENVLPQDHPYIKTVSDIYQSIEQKLNKPLRTQPLPKTA